MSLLSPNLLSSRKIGEAGIVIQFSFPDDSHAFVRDSHLISVSSLAPMDSVSPIRIPLLSLFISQTFVFARIALHSLVIFHVLYLAFALFFSPSCYSLLYCVVVSNSILRWHQFSLQPHFLRPILARFFFISSDFHLLSILPSFFSHLCHSTKKLLKRLFLLPTLSAWSLDYDYNFDYNNFSHRVSFGNHTYSLILNKSFCEIQANKWSPYRLFVSLSHNQLNNLLILSYQVVSLGALKARAWL